MKRALISLALVATFAQAECYYTSATTVRVNSTVEAVDSVKYMAGNGMCSVTARVMYRKQWHNIMGMATNPTRAQQDLCLDALESGVRDFIARQEGKRVEAHEQMACTDMPQTQELKEVKKNDIISVSQVQPHPKRPAFVYQGAQCRWFVETALDGDNFRQMEGVICRIGRPDQDRWIVVDKW
jgi:hypothetical protein